MKKQLLSLAFIATLGVAQAQNTTSPSYTTNPSPIIDGTGAVTLTFDLSQTALAASAFSGDVYIYTGIDILPKNAAAPVTWQHVRRAWGDVANDATYKLTAGATDMYTYTMPNLRVFYGIGADTAIVTMNFVLRNAAGDKQAGDLKLNVTQGTPTGIIKVKSNELSLSVAPNPVNDVMKISFNNIANEKASLVLVNVVGQAVISMNEVQETTTLSVRDLPAGVYFLKMSIGDKQITKKVVKE